MLQYGEFLEFARAQREQAQLQNNTKERQLFSGDRVILAHRGALEGDITRVYRGELGELMCCVQWDHSQSSWYHQEHELRKLTGYVRQAADLKDASTVSTEVPHTSVDSPNVVAESPTFALEGSEARPQTHCGTPPLGADMAAAAPHQEVPAESDAAAPTSCSACVVQ